MRRPGLSLILVALCAVVAMPASASPQGDFDAVYADWKADKVITQCRWTQAQLQNANDVANSNPDFQYETGFQDAVQAEINRWKAGGCSGVAPTSVKKASALTGAHITAVKPRGSARSELVKIRNGARTTLPFRKAALRNSKGVRAVFPAQFKLKPRKVAVVHLGCARGQRHASFRGTTVYLCRRAELLRDKGDVAKLTDASGVVVSQRGFGSKKRQPSF